MSKDRDFMAGSSLLVTRVEERGKSRSLVELDSGETFVLYRGEFRTLHIREGEALSREDYDRIRNEILPGRARLRALNLLKSRDYTTQQLRRKLEQGGYPEEIVEEALCYVASFHYTDDLRYASDYIAGHGDSRSRMRIFSDLQRRGISRETCEAAWAAWEEREGGQDEQAMMKALLVRKNFDPGQADFRERQRMYGFLTRKGFSPEQVSRVLRVDDISF